MVTATELPVRWDHFLEASARPQVEGFRRVQWPNIKRDLSKLTELAEGLEPCWVAPGRAVYWQNTTSRVAVIKHTEDGREYRELEDFERGFEPTLDLPANNASTIAAYLKKGFLLRPPGQEIVEEEDTVPTDEPTQTSPEYTCLRHGADRKMFKNWKAYIQHLTKFSEAPEYDLPADVMVKAGAYKFYCPIHDRGFNNPAHAARHMKSELRKPGRSYHPSIDDMRIAEETNA